ncbi:MAG: single-stranded-DNA-specific exonuclease RecJ [Clostridia bacterium]|nr:single-stranded-DNA-specific exonuclease RecJ [Clostridia bacterium]
MRKKWVFGNYDSNRAAALAERCNIAPFTALLLNTRGIDTPEKVAEFFDADGPLGDPFALKDMDKAAACVTEAVESGARICVYGDYDADGVTATAVLYSYLDAMGADVTYYIPSRTRDGYGLNPDAVARLAAAGTALIITVDNGVSALEAAEKAAALGVKLIVTDHHKPGDTLPQAAAVVDPHRADDTSGLSYLTGVGVAFKLVCAVENADFDDMLAEYAQPVAIGTVADLMPLVGENRKLVAAGLRAMNAAPMPGIEALIDAAGLRGKTLNSGNIAFGLAPRINAAGRMGSADLSVQLMLCDDPETAAACAAELERMNNERHSAEAVISEEIGRMLAADAALAADSIIVVSGKGWHEGVIGIAASRVVERYGRPAIVICENEDGAAKGSCRGVEGFSIFEALKSCEELLTNYGGHTLAAGLGLRTADIPAFRKKINAYAAAHLPPAPTLTVSCKLNPAGVTVPLLDELEALEPFGTGNPEPTFAFCGMTVTDIRPIGGGKHSRLEFRRGDKSLQAVRFGFAPDALPFEKGDTVDIAAIIKKNEFNGRVLPSVQIKDVRFSGTDDEALFASYAIYRKLEAGVALTPQERAAACPARTEIIRVYKFLRTQSSCSAEALLKKLKFGDGDFCKLLVILRALTDGGLITREDGVCAAVANPKKIDLETIPILARLGYINQ